MQPIKIISFLCAIGFTLSVLAQSNQSNQPPKDLQPLPELPDLTHEEPDLPDLGGDPALEPEVTIIQGKEETIEEYRVNGQLYMIKVIPRIGKPFYLMNKRSPVGEPHRGDLESGISVPMWELYRF
ncbi:DUF2782 domain-containing protein [Nitrosomonas sp.]|uniref:DUF2782 domain-containing protein n=1 Tax=Nitrosomonas sp. TaxID=42353 RepID=UPI00261D327A|nr:DUF2782 domain-containing protein [Nitrosomonas sp.]MCW5598284.1 DUF2782 domain-containing protein [Nitrosomonas sp.]MCW5600851.1 DUF2782 domain-containing protein [Nitrosomonas sp.]